MSGRGPETPDPSIPQDPGIPGRRAPDEQPPRQTPEVERVPESGEPDVDDEGHMRPAERPQRSDA
jgi:hypothetical protein